MKRNELSFSSRLSDSLGGSPELSAYALKRFSEQASAAGLFEAVDASVFNLFDWVNALPVLDQWLDKNQLELSLRQSLDYLNCVAEAGVKTVGLESLASVTEEMLAAYGCEAAVKKS